MGLIGNIEGTNTSVADREPSLALLIVPSDENTIESSLMDIVLDIRDST